MTRIFGTDGVRGVSNKAPMDSETILRLGRAAAHVLARGKKRARILIGKDTRLSGYMLETALESGISSMGGDVYLLGPLPTPGVAFMTRSMRADAGIMISASHNPYQDNGIKFFGADGFKLADATEEEIESCMQPGFLDQHRATADTIGKAYRIDDAVGRYTVYLKNCIKRYFKLDGLKIVVDAAHGAAYKVAPLVFSELGAELITVGAKPDGKNINAGVGSLHPEVISQKVLESGADCGIAYDGDADRVVLCDEKGQIFDGDKLLALCAFDFKKQGILKGDAVVGTVMSNLGLEQALAKEGIALHRAGVGDRLVLAEMLERGLNLGGEQSGHLISLDHNTTGDGILTSLIVLSILQNENKPLSDFYSIVVPCPQILLNVAIKNKKPFESLPGVQAALKDADKKLGKKGRVLLRYSGTEAKARVMVEAESDILCKQIAENIASEVERELAG